jgi:hypothetical protein
MPFCGTGWAARWLVLLENANGYHGQEGTDSPARNLFLLDVFEYL